LPYVNLSSAASVFYSVSSRSLSGLQWFLVRVVSFLQMSSQVNVYRDRDAHYY